MMMQHDPCRDLLTVNAFSELLERWIANAALPPMMGWSCRQVIRVMRTTLLRVITNQSSGKLVDMDVPMITTFHPN